MRFALLWLALGLPAQLPAAPVITLVNDAGLPADQIESLRSDYSRWAVRVYRYNHVSTPLPVNLVLTRKVPFGYYVRPNVYVPPDTADEMLETWVHELAHHATGHQSSFFFKEGIAVNTLEALFAEDHRVPQGFPQYGARNDAWVSLFINRNQLPPLVDLMRREGYDNSSADNDFRSWQVYIAGGSFMGWLIRTEGYDTFRTVFWDEELGARGADWERRWRDFIRNQKLADLNPAEMLPETARYRRYAERLRAR